MIFLLMLAVGLDILADVSCGLGEAMVDINLNDDKAESYANMSE